MKKNNLLIIHGGGPTAVINASLYGALSEAKRYGELDHIYAAIGGTGGFIRENLRDLRDIPDEMLIRLKSSPGSAIGTSRDRLEDAEYKKIAALAEKYSIKYIICNGGNGTMDTCGKIYQACSGFGIKVIGLPKTMDNDISVTDHAPGYGSAARYIAGSVAEVSMDVLGMPSHIVIIETSGRNAGWIAASAALAKLSGAPGADLIYMPERLFSEDEFLADVSELISQKKSGVVVVSEGLLGTDGKPLVEPTRVVSRSISYGSIAAHLQELIQDKLNYKARGEKPGLLGRASIAWQSAVDRDEAILAGRQAVCAALSGENGKMVSFRRISDDPYEITTELTDISEVMLHEKKLPDAFINSRGNYVTPDFIDYCRPLIGAPLPQYVSLRQ